MTTVERSVDRSAAMPWMAADIAGLGRDLARSRSQLWRVADPDELAGWVFADPVPAPLNPALALAPPDWADELDEARRRAWALLGWTVRMAVPDPVQTAGRHWLVTRVPDGGGPVLRLTVGVLETLGLFESGEGVWLRVAGWPIEPAIESGVIDLAEWERRGVTLREDSTKTLAGEKILFSCPDLETAHWLLRQRMVLIAARLLNVLVAKGPFPYVSRYQPETAGRAWLAAESLIMLSSAAEHGFDRAYVSPAGPVELPVRREFDADAYRAGVAEHDRLCRRLIGELASAGLRAGAGLSGVPVDLAWRGVDGRQYIAEVKSVVPGNASEQLRLGLGQVLEYRHRLAVLGMTAAAVLVATEAPDPLWLGVCADASVLLLAGDDRFLDL